MLNNHFLCRRKKIPLINGILFEVTHFLVEVCCEVEGKKQDSKIICLNNWFKFNEEITQSKNHSIARRNIEA